MFVKIARAQMESSAMRRSLFRLSGATALAAVCLLILAAPPARADWHGGWHGGAGWHGGGWRGGWGWHRGGWGWRGARWNCCWRGGVFIGVAPRLYVPPRPYYPPQPAYYYYPPPYYAPYGYAYPGY